VAQAGKVVLHVPPWAPSPVFPQDAHAVTLLLFAAVPSYVEVSVQAPSLGGAQRLIAQAVERPDAVAIRHAQGAIRYDELAVRVAKGAGALMAFGVLPGSRVGIMLGNVPAFVEVWLAAAHLGAIAVPLNPALAPDELRHALDDAGATVVVSGSATVEAVLAVAHEVRELRGVIVVGREQPGGTTGRWSDLLEAASAAPVATVSAEDIATIVYTSGTTGRPRGAMLTYGQLDANQRQSLAGRVQIQPSDAILVVLPVSHIYALNVGLAAALSVGATVVLEERFDPSTTLDTIVERDVTVVLGAPPMYAAWLALDVDPARFAGVRVAVSGSAALPKGVFRSFLQVHGITILEGYGLTEAGPSVTSNALALEPRAGSVGLPLPELELRIVNETGKEVAQGDEGEVQVRGPNIFLGYWRDPEATAAVLDAEGWLHTGDVGVQDADGHLYLVDRMLDLIIVSGFNVYPREVERVLQAHDGVAEAAVVGVSHPYSGEAVKAFVVPSDPEVTADELAAHCRAFLARYKCPDSLVLVDALPHTATGKVRRGALRDES
jgi:long-chain acyl-CoA synthetase